MTVRLSTGMRDKLLNGGASGGLKNALNLGFIAIYSGPQPLSADTGATGTLLATVSVAEKLGIKQSGQMPNNTDPPLGLNNR